MVLAYKKEWLYGWAIALGAVILIYVFVAIRADRSTLSLKSGDKIGEIAISGPIYDAEAIVRRIESLGEQRSIKALLVRIDSPGGLVVPSQEIYEALCRFRNQGKPVLAFMGSVAASGGYYIACGADTIMAEPGTTTGSIGVIAEFINLRELFEKIGIRFEVIKSGRFKDTGSPHRDLTPDERRYLQAWIDDAYDQFVSVVEKERRMSRSRVLAIADGRVFTGRQALTMGLVDTLGYYNDALGLVARMAGIPGKPVVVREKQKRTTLLDLFFDETRGLFLGGRGFRLKYQFQY